MAVPNLVVPKLKNIEENYRIGFDTLNGPEFNKEVEATIQRPDSDNLFGTTSGEDEPEVIEPPPKKKTKKVKFFVNNCWTQSTKRNF